jgi:hypothetical protein
MGKILRKILGPEEENGVCRTCTNQELINLYKELDIISQLEKGSWLRHVERMSEERPVKRAFKNTPEAKSSDEKERERWLDYTKNYQKKKSVLEAAEK